MTGIASTISFNSRVFRFSDRSWVNVICLLACFPFISIIPGLSAEVQPYCYLAAIAFVILFRTPLPSAYFWFLTLAGSYFLYFLAKQLVSIDGIDLQSIPHLLIYIGPPLFFWVLYKNFNHLKLRWLHNAFYAWVFTGFLQELFPSIFATIGLKQLLENLIPRFNVQSLAEFGDRGVTSLSNEPSYAGILLFTLFTVIIYRFITEQISRRHFYIDLILFTVSVVFNASLTMFLLTFLLFIALIYQTRKFRLAAVFLAILILPFFLFDIQFRIIDMMALMPELLEAADWNPYYVMIGPLGSHREFSANVGIQSGFYHFFGNGYYSSMMEFISVAKRMNIDLERVKFFDYTNYGYYTNMKPYGYGALLIFELGVIPFILINGILFRLLLRAHLESGPYRRLGSVIAFASILLMNVNTPVSLPAYWMVILFAIMMIRYKKSEGDEAGMA